MCHTAKGVFNLIQRRKEAIVHGSCMVKKGEFKSAWVIELTSHQVAFKPRKKGKRRKCSYGASGVPEEASSEGTIEKGS